MKVLFIAPAPPPVGGIESVTKNLLDYLKLNPNGVDLILLNTTHRFRPVTSKSILIRLLSGLYNSLRTYISTLKIIKKDKPDILHLASSASLALLKDILILFLSNKYKIPTVLHLHFGRIPSLKEKNNWEWKLLKRVIKMSHSTIVIDNKSYDSLMKEGYNTIANIPNPLSLEVESQAQNLNYYPVSRKEGQLIYVGHLIYDKGVYELVTACTQVDAVEQLILIGPYENKVKEELIQIANLRSNGNWLVFTGEIEITEVLSYMKNAPILVLPSYTEGFPMVILEGMAMGCSIIATDVGAISDMIGINSNVPNGHIVPIKNVEKLKDAIGNMLQDKNLIETYSRRGVQRVLENYTMKSVYSQYYSIWKDLNV